MLFVFSNAVYMVANFVLTSCVLPCCCRELGGFKEVPIMEDYDLVKRLRQHGPPAIIPHALHTSGRRWQTVGFFRTTLTNQVGVTHGCCGCVGCLGVCFMVSTHGS